MGTDHTYRDTADACRIYFMPNLFTAGNLFFGFLAIIRFIQAKYGSMVGHSPVDLYTQGIWLIVIASVFDLIDGRIARFGGRTSLFGAEFDSLADLVSFGVAPALLVFFLILSPSPGNYPQYLDSIFLKVGWLVGFIYLLCCAARLARFNVLTTPLLPKSEKHAAIRDSIGLPVPAAAGVIVAVAVIIVRAEVAPAFAALLLPLMLMVSLLMVSTMLFPVFKHINWSLRTGFFTFLCAAIICSMLLFFSVYSIAIVFPGYVAYGVLRYFIRTRSRTGQTQERISAALHGFTDENAANGAGSTEIDD